MSKANDVARMCELADQLWVACAPPLEVLVETQTHAYTQLTKLLLLSSREKTGDSLEKAKVERDVLARKLEVARANLSSLAAEKQALEDKLTSCQQQLRKTHKALEFQTKKQSGHGAALLHMKARLVPPEMQVCRPAEGIGPSEVFGGSAEVRYKGKKGGMVQIREPVSSQQQSSGGVESKTP